MKLSKDLRLINNYLSIAQHNHMNRNKDVRDPHINDCILMLNGIIEDLERPFVAEVKKDEIEHYALTDPFEILTDELKKAEKKLKDATRWKRSHPRDVVFEAEVNKCEAVVLALRNARANIGDAMGKFNVPEFGPVQARSNTKEYLLIEKAFNASQANVDRYERELATTLTERTREYFLSAKANEIAVSNRLSALMFVLNAEAENENDSEEPVIPPNEASSLVHAAYKLLCCIPISVEDTELNDAFSEWQEEYFRKMSGTLPIPNTDEEDGPCCDDPESEDDSNGPIVGDNGIDDCPLPKFEMPRCTVKHFFKEYKPSCKHCQKEVLRQFEQTCLELWRVQRMTGVYPNVYDSDVEDVETMCDEDVCHNLSPHKPHSRRCL